ncbi:divalent-cation tolerance protein CutA [Polynucleobacter sp. MWH-UH25E]|uniref:divalent-cation tolerance protein CutA n=1 Tax=Polynucleobacter sp. MWH-UH25E TaxID=1855616 RepID=UPI001BFDF4C9|nr:divalent-cation tolerance protein CutA [Polynucleobacter sp. MWH-UH25E]QWD62125.1 divalent-cation tolerance protein CutA [Polynucleobacter sp. MWH-UH25E]
MPQNLPEIAQSKSSQLLVVVTSLPSMEAAQSLARDLVDQELAACVQLSGGIQSIYRWEGKVCEESEVLLSAKTTANQWPIISSFIQKNHPYDLPEILAFTPEQYSKQYGAWVNSEVNS